MKKTCYFLAVFIYIQSAYGVPQYYCTASNWAFFNSLLNLIGSIHHSNFDELEQIAVFDLGLYPEQIEFLEGIEKVAVYPLEKTHPEMTDYFQVPERICLGWYAWKSPAIKQALKMFPYVLYTDAGTEIRNSLAHLFEYIQTNKYFLCTIGDHRNSTGKWIHSVGWGITSFVKDKFEMNGPDKKWILDQESVMGGVIGVSRDGQSFFLDDLYELSKDLRNFADDGTASKGWGSARHDQVLMSILAYSRNLTIHKQDGKRKDNPILLPIDNQIHPFYITWDKNLVDTNTCIYSCRVDNTNHTYYLSKIRKKGEN